ncbi:MAG: ABC-F family ATP-binding cassette domain-containing protein [Armatimonadota bacterium]
MAVITVSNLKKSFGPRELFSDVSFFINEKERVALVGDNGTGKTTLLRIICGESDADSGNIGKEPGMTVGYLPQEVDLPGTSQLQIVVMGVTPELLDAASTLADIESRLSHTTSEKESQELGSKYAEISHRFDTLHGFDYQIKAKSILLGLGFTESDLDRPVHTLSGGQKMRVALARLLLLSPDMLLLDEPTNHLDIQACEWLQSFINDKFPGAVLVVSHDRYFLDRVVSKVVEIEFGTTVTYTGNYSAFAVQKAERIEEQRKQYKLQQKEITRIESAIQTLFSNRKFSRRDNKVKQLNRIERVHKPGERMTIKTNLTPAGRSGLDVVRIKKLSKNYPNKPLFSEMDFVVERGRKIGIVGPNGSGKTTLLKILADKLQADDGVVEFGHNVQPVYFAQEFDHLVPERTVIEELLADADLTSSQARDLLAQFLFMGDDAFKRVNVLSGGEMCRLALAKILANHPNLLILDEPTNHLDIRSREALEEALKSFNGTILTASHDRYLLDAIATDIIEIKDGSWERYLGNYSDYREKTQPAEEHSPTPAAVKKQVAAPRRSAGSQLRVKERQLKELSKRQKELEHGIEQVEGRMGELTEALADEETYRNGTAGELTKEYDGLAAKLDTFYREWETTCSQVAELEDEIASQLEGSRE